MKSIIWFILSLYSLAIVFASCNNNKSSASDRDLLAQDSAMNLTIDSVSDLVCDSGRVSLDTVIGKWHVKTVVKPRGVNLYRDNYEYPDSFEILKVSYGGKLLVDKQISANDLMAEKDVYLFGTARLYWVSDSALSLSYGCYMPESDVGDEIFYQITANGDTYHRAIDGIMGWDGFDLVSNFMTIYLNERAAGIKAEDLEPLYKEYLSESLAESLINGSAAILPDCRDYHYVDSTMRIEPVDSSDEIYKNDTIYFSVEFNSDPAVESAKDTLYVEVFHKNTCQKYYQYITYIGQELRKFTPDSTSVMNDTILSETSRRSY